MKYYVFIETGAKHTCPYFDTLEQAMELYNETEMTKFRDNVFLGISSDNVTPTEGYCFDVLHKFFDENILINVYLNHTDTPEAMKKVKEIIQKFDIRYQLVHDILNAVLIDYKMPFAKSLVGHEVKEKWNEIYVSTLEGNQFINTGWVEYSSKDIDNYTYDWPNGCSYVGLMNVTVIDSCGYPHMVDVDPRDYLLALGKKVSIPERSDDNENT